MGTKSGKVGAESEVTTEEAVDAVASPPPVKREPEKDRCVPYYNPISINTRFFVGQQASYSYFSSGKYIACTDEQKASVENVLRYYGEDKVEAWRGDDRDTEYVAKSTGFRTFNSKAQRDHMDFYNL